VENLKISGGCVIRNMYKQSTLDAMETEIRPHLDATEKSDGKITLLISMNLANECLQASEKTSSHHRQGWLQDD
jgi:hypothetical protein